MVGFPAPESGDALWFLSKERARKPVLPGMMQGSPPSVARHCCADALGRPNEGPHAWRLGGFAGVDVVGTALLAAGTAALVTHLGGFRWPLVFAWFGVALCAWFALATLLHFAFGVQTRFVTMVSGEPFPPPRTSDGGS